MPKVSSTLPSRPARREEWTTETAERTARELGLRLSAPHWLVLGCAREECLTSRHRPTASVLSRTTGLSPEEIGRLFPGDSCALIAAIAGLDRDGLAGSP